MFKFLKFFRFFRSREHPSEVQRLREIANGEPTVVKRDTAIYLNNNKNKPFSMNGIVARLELPLATSPEIERQREIYKCEQSEFSISDNALREVSKVSVKKE